MGIHFRENPLNRNIPDPWRTPRRAADDLSRRQVAARDGHADHLPHGVGLRSADKDGQVRPDPDGDRADADSGDGAGSDFGDGAAGQDG